MQEHSYTQPPARLSPTPSAAVAGRSSARALDVQLLEDVARAAELVRHEEHVADVHVDGPALVVVVEEVVAEPFVVAVEDDADLLAAPVQHGAPGVAADDVVGREEVNGHVLAAR